MRYIYIFLFLVFSIGQAQAAETKLNIVASNTFLADVVKHIGGDKVEVKSIASPKYNIHFYQPTPNDVRAVKNADLYVNFGLDLEAWSDPLLEAAGNPKFFRGAENNVDMSKGIHLLHEPHGPVTRAEGDIHLFGNPHYHLNPENLKIMANTLNEALSALDSQNKNYYKQQTEMFLTKLEQKIGEWKSSCRHCTGQEIISYHDDTAYLADFLGMKAETFLEPKPGISPTPKHIRFIEDYIKANKIKVIAQSTFYSRKLADRLKQNSDIHVVIIAQMPGEVKGTENVFDFFDYNIKALSEALR